VGGGIGPLGLVGPWIGYRVFKKIIIIMKMSHSAWNDEKRVVLLMKKIKGSSEEDP